MRAGKDEKKQMDPLFPRLHINDAERGGQRAPPRNKMALCEQVNTPSQRLSSGTMSMRSLPSSNSTNLVPSASLKHAHCQKKNGLSLFSGLPESSYMAERVHSNSSVGMNLKDRYTEFQISKPGNFQAFSARRSLKMTSEFQFFQPYGFYNSKNSSAEKLGNENDPRIPCFGQREKILNCCSVEHKMVKENATSSSLSFSKQHQTALKRQKKEIGRNDVKSREHPRNQAENNSKVSEMTDDNAEILHSHPSAGEKVLAEAAPTPSSLAIFITGESVNRALVPINHSSNSSAVHDLSTLYGTCTQVHQESRSFPVETAVDNNTRDPERLSRKRSFATMESPSCSGPPTRENNRNPNRIESVNDSPNGNDCASSHAGDVRRNSAISDNSVVDSISGLGISPGDVVGVIGPKSFWSVRRTIAHQQRIFAVQIFELHRLIKVQRLIAESPEILFEDNVIFNKPSVKIPIEKKLQSKTCLDYVAEDAHRKLPVPTYDSEKGHFASKSALKPYPGALTPTSYALDASIGPWCFDTSPGYQWLVPVGSPSEGLVYKPYTGPFPPIASCITPVYGGCGTMSLTRNYGDYVNTTYGIPTSNHQGIGVYSGPAALGRPCFQTYALPMINTSNLSLAVKQTNPLATSRSSGQHNACLSTYDINYTIPYRILCDVTSQKSEIMTDSSRTVAVSRGRDFQGNTDSTPEERMQGDALSLFPTTATGQMSPHPVQNHNTQQQIQVVKVVPHNPKSAYESVARIFQSIQEERKQHE